MHNWYNSNIPGILYIHGHRLQFTTIHGAFPLLSSPLASSPLSPLCTPFYLLGTLLAVTGFVHLSLRLLVNWPPLFHPSPKPSPHQIPRTPTAQHLTKTTSGLIRRLLSGTSRTGTQELASTFQETKRLHRKLSWVTGVVQIPTTSVFKDKFSLLMVVELPFEKFAYETGLNKDWLVK